MPGQKRIGLLMDNSTSYGRSVYAGIRRHYLPRLDVDLRLAEPSPQALDRWRDDRPDALIAHVADPAVAAELRRWSIPLINVSNALAEDFARVGVDDTEIGRLAADYFVERHYRNFGYLGFEDRIYSRLRRDGFAQRLRESGLDCVAFAWPRNEDIERQLAQWLRGMPQPLAVLVVGDERALRVIEACKEIGLAVPDGVAVLSGTNDEQVCAMSRPTLSAVQHPAERIGQEAARLLDRWIEGEPPTERVLLIPPTHVVERESTNAEAIADREVAAALGFIRQHAHEAIGVEQVVAVAGTGRRNLERKFAALLDRSIYGHIMATRLNRAKLLLQTTDLGLEAIARGSGFAGPQHFCDVFKRKLGLTPGEYRRRSAGSSVPGRA